MGAELPFSFIVEDIVLCSSYAKVTVNFCGGNKRDYSVPSEIEASNPNDRTPHRQQKTHTVPGYFCNGKSNGHLLLAKCIQGATTVASDSPISHLSLQ
jgi:hypothetical protein